MIWVSIFPPYTNYEISTKGDIRRRLESGKIKKLSPGIDSTGYRRVLLYSNGKRKGYRVHQIVAKMFVAPKKGHHIRFIDGNKLNVSASNLKWRQDNEVGVEFDKDTKRWRATKYHKNRKIFMGFHSTKEDALKARRA